MNTVFREVFQQLPIGLFHMNARGELTEISQKLASMLGWDDPDELISCSGLAEIFLNNEERGEVLATLLEGGDTFHKEICLNSRSGPDLWVDVRIGLVRLNGDASLVGVVDDISGKKAREQRLRNKVERYRGLYECSPDGTMLCTPAGDVLECNQTLADMLGYQDPQSFVNDVFNLGQLLSSDSFPWQESGQTGQPQDEDVEERLECEIRKSDKNWLWGLLSVNPVRDAQGRILLYQISVRDISRRKAVEARLRSLEHQDQVTGLYTRQMFTSFLGKAVARSRRYGEYDFALAVMDVDRMRLLNENLGPEGGDEILAHVAEVINRCLREEDICARIGGDEFAVLMSDIARPRDAVRVVKRILDMCARPVSIRGKDAFVRLKTGIVMSDDRYDSAETMLADADMAIYRARMDKDEDYAVFNRGMQQKAVEMLRLETDLRGADERSEFTLSYQPIISLSTGCVKKFEALIRWERPGVGMIPPMRFVPILEEMGLIANVGQWVLEKACRQARLWQLSSPRFQDLVVSVNVSPRQLVNGQLEKGLDHALARSGLHPSHLELEITESVIMEDPELARQTLTAMHDRGIRIAIDDFGTGHSSLAYLHRLPASTLKIDRSFLHDSDRREGDAIIRTIRLLAGSLGREVVAEGVETDEQLSTVISAGCEYAQGFYFSKPIGPEKAFKLLQEGACY